MPVNCKRCGLGIVFENGRPLDASTGIPHSIKSCKTKPGYVYCPKHMEVFSQKNPCSHYTKYGYQPGQSENFFIERIQEDYCPGDWFKRKQNRKNSFDKMKEGQKCNRCGLVFPRNATRQDTDSHEQECKLQTKLA